MSQGSMTPSFEYFCKGFINQNEQLTSSGQLTLNKSLTTLNKNNPKIFFHKNPKSHTKGSSLQSFNDACVDVSKNKVFNPCRYCGKTNHTKIIFFKIRHEFSKSKKKSFVEQ
jgi:hypothetical protein